MNVHKAPKVFRRVANALKIKTNRKQRQQQQQPLVPANDEDEVNFSNLPKEIKLEVLSFIFDEVETIENIMDSPAARGEDQDTRLVTKRHISNSILESTSNEEMRCKLCSNLLCYPYQLIDNDCGHIVCGMCAWKCRQALSSCSCGIRVRSRPIRLDPAMQNCRAHWLLTKSGKFFKSTKKKSKSFCLILN